MSFSLSINWDNYSQKKKIFFQNNIDMNLNQNMNFSFCHLLLKYEPRIKDKEFYDKEQKINRNLFYIYLLKELSPRTFS